MSHEQTRIVPISDGARLSVYDRGAGHVMLLVHGFPLDHSMWEEQFAALSVGHRVLAPDLRGFGASDVTEGKVSMEQFADDLADMLDALHVEEPVTFCGLSMGGYIGWQFARKYSNRLARLVLCDTRAAPDNPEAAEGRLKMAEQVLASGTEAVAEAMLPKLFAPATLASRRELVGAVKRVILDAPPQGIAAALHGMRERIDARPLLGAIRVPTLVVVGESDAISPPEEMRQIAEAIPGARFAIIPDAGHMCPLENPAAVNRELLAAD